MADPLSIIGTASAVASIIDLVCKIVSTLKDLHEKWQNTDFTLLSIASQLTTFKNALVKIQEWLSSSDGSVTHHQLAMDLDVTLNYCQLLVTKVEAYTDGIVGNGQIPDLLESKLRFKALRDSKALEEVQKMIDRQTNALNLLLTATICSTRSQQQRLLERSTSRKTMKRMERASASLFVNYDKGSIFSRCTDNLSKLSCVFDFDSEVLSSGPYERVLRLSMKDILRRHKVNMKEQSSEQLVDLPERNWSTEAVCCEEDSRPITPSLHRTEHPTDQRSSYQSRYSDISTLGGSTGPWNNPCSPQEDTHDPHVLEADSDGVYELDAVGTEIKVTRELDAVETEVIRAMVVERQKAEANAIELLLEDQLIYLRLEQSLLKL